jgi:hypothetical protein
MFTELVVSMMENSGRLMVGLLSVEHFGACALSSLVVWRLSKPDCQMMMLMM